MSYGLVIAVAVALLLPALAYLALARRRRRDSHPVPPQGLVLSSAAAGYRGAPWRGALRFAIARDATAAEDALVAVAVESGAEAEAAADATRRVADGFVHALKRSARDGGRLPHLLDVGVAAAQDAARRATQGAAGDAAMTVAAVAVTGGMLHWSALGDLRILLLRRGRLHQVTLDHTFGTLLAGSVARGRLSPGEAAAKKERQALTGHVGSEDPPPADRSLRPVALEDGDAVVLCTPGVYQRLSAADIEEALARPGRDAAGAVLEASLRSTGDAAIRQDAACVVVSLDHAHPVGAAPTGAAVPDRATRAETARDATAAATSPALRSAGR